MKLEKDAKIITQEGETIGSVKRFVLDPGAKKLTHLVFEHGLLTKTEYLVPIELIDHMQDDEIHLRELPVDNFIELQRFQETEYIITDESAMLDGDYVVDDPASTYYYYPSTTFGGVAHPGMLPPDVPAETQSPVGLPSNHAPTRMASAGSEPPVRKQVEENIPLGTVAIKEGAKVISSDDKNVGDIDKIIINPQNKQVTHFLITKGIFNQEKKLVPVNWIKEVYEEEIHLIADQRLLERLPVYKEED